MGDDIVNDVRGIKEPQEPEIDTGGSGADESADQRQGTQSKVPYIHKRGHRKEAKHLAVSGHNARHVVQRIHRKEKNSEAESTLPDGRVAAGHGAYPTSKLECATVILRGMRILRSLLCGLAVLGVMCTSCRD